MSDKTNVYIFLACLPIGIPLGIWLGITFAPGLLDILGTPLIGNILTVILIITVLFCGIGAGLSIGHMILGCWEEILKDKDKD